MENKRKVEQPLTVSNFGKDFVLTYLTDSSLHAGWAAAAGVQRIGPDLESLGKLKRQALLKSRISDHSIACLPSLAKAIGSRACLFARINPMNPDSAQEIQEALSAGVSVLMLPYFHRVAEVQNFVSLVDGRARCVLLVETAASAVCIDEVVSTPGVDEIHLGLTDLMISLGLDSRFYLMTSWFVDSLAARIRNAGKPLCVAGVARVSDKSLPIPSELIIPQFVRLNARGALLTRHFTHGISDESTFTIEVARLRDELDRCALLDRAEIDRKHSMLIDLIAERRRVEQHVP